jgi:cobyrinic acid a,c-diamide synthase
LAAAFGYQRPGIEAAGRGEGGRPVIGVVRDRAFQFYYPDNLEALEHQGAILREIDALEDQELPEIDALYIGGGFPETQAAELAANRSFCMSVKNAVEDGLPVYAECGGLIYLGRTLRVGATTYPMTAVLPADFVLEKKLQAHGYTVGEVSCSNPFFARGTVLRGHEFHYSRVANPDELPDLCFTMQRGQGIAAGRDGIVYRNVLATYTHLHAVGMPRWAEGMIRSARAFRERKKVGAQ